MSALPLSRLQSPERQAEQAIRDFQGETAEITERPYPVKARLTIWLMAAMVVLFFTYCYVMRMDKVVVAAGRVETQSPTLVVQPLETSLIKAIHVRAGQVVHKGDTLVTLDPTFTVADVAQLDQQISSFQAEIARMQVEADGEPFVAGKNPSPEMRLQESIWRYRVAEDKAKLANFDQRIATAVETIRRGTEEAKFYSSRVAILSDVEGMRQELERNRTGSRLNSLLASDTLLDVRRSLATAENAARSAQHDLEALRAEREAYIQQRRSSLLSDLSTRQVDLSRAIEERAKAERRHELVALKAADDAVVLEIGSVSIGSVAQGGEKLMTLVPTNAAMEVTAEIPAADQGHVKVGDDVQIKFAAYRFNEHGMAKGVVRTISEDSFTKRPDQTQATAPFFRARIEFTDLNLRNVPEDFRLIPGMPVTADIIVGDRSIISYFTEEVINTSSEGMREP